jgi:hypothetical protein
LALVAAASGGGDVQFEVQLRDEPLSASTVVVARDMIVRAEQIVNRRMAMLLAVNLMVVKRELIIRPEV